MIALLAALTVLLTLTVTALLLIIRYLLTTRAADTLSAHQLTTAALTAVTDAARQSNAEVTALARDIILPPDAAIPTPDELTHVPDLPDEPFTDPTYDWLPDEVRTTGTFDDLPPAVAEALGLPDPDLTGEELDL